jgi:hypothetical protein
MTNRAEVVLTANTRQFEQQMGRARSATNAIGSTVSRTSIALGPLARGFGQVTNAVGSLAGALATGGVLGGAIAAVSIGIVGLIAHFKKAREEIRDSVRSFAIDSGPGLETLTNRVKGLQRELQLLGKTGRELQLAGSAIDEAKVRRSIQISESELESFDKRRKQRIERMEAETKRAQLGMADKASFSIRGLFGKDEISVEVAKENEARKTIIKSLDEQRKKLAEYSKEQEALTSLAAGEAQIAAQRRKEEEADARRKERDAERRRKERENEKAYLDLIKDLDKAIADQEEQRRRAQERAARDADRERQKAEEERQRQLQHEQMLAQQRRQNIENFAIMMTQATAMTIGRELQQRIALDEEIRRARKAGNWELVKQLEAQERSLLVAVLASTMEMLSQVAIAEGAIMLIKGIGSKDYGRAAAGTALIGLGIGGMAGSAAIAARFGGGAVQVEAPTGGNAVALASPTMIDSGARVAGPQQTVINYYFGGPVFGSYDSASRAVASMNKRGQYLGVA